MLRCLALLCLWVGVAWAQAQQPVPELKARVTDLTGTLSSGQRAALEQRLQSFEDAKGAQIAVLIVPSTQPEAIEPYALRVAETWQLGRKGIDDGVLLVVAKDDRRLRLEIGYGLEGAIPDAIAKRVISEIITPRFQDGDFYGGIEAGVERLIRLIEGEPLPSPEPRDAQRTLPAASLVLLFFLLPLLSSFGRMAGQLIGAGLGGLASAGIVYWLTGAFGLALLFGVAGAVFVLLSGSGMITESTRGRYRHGGGYGGGGGGFGGGGASGRW